MGKKLNVYIFWSENLKEECNFEELGLDRRIILKCILNNR
jgi:hypothetical protein